MSFLLSGSGEKDISDRTAHADGVGENSTATSVCWSPVLEKRVPGVEQVSQDELSCLLQTKQRAAERRDGVGIQKLPGSHGCSTCHRSGLGSRKGSVNVLYRGCRGRK